VTNPRTGWRVLRSSFFVLRLGKRAYEEKGVVVPCNHRRMKKGILIECVEPGSIAMEMEIEPGDLLLSINGHRVRDLIDYGFYSDDDELLLEIEKPVGEVWEVEIEREEGESLGLRFAAPKPSRCANACLFCFVDQLPTGLRRSLYVKDEDYRLSFLYGNFVTLSSLSRGALRRIREQRLSPLYVSVHATDPHVRGELLGNRDCPPILKLLRELADAGITMHTQVVLCPGLNDGMYLESTVRDLAELFPRVASLAVVPVGLTRYRTALAKLQPVTRDYAADFIAQWQPRARGLASRLGTPFLFLGDEFYLKADVPFPSLEEYGDLPQLENGVGMVPLFLADAAEVFARAEPLTPAEVTVITGKSAFRTVDDFLRMLSERTGVFFRTVAIENSLFGDSVTVAGLVPGKAVLEGLRGREADGLLLIPDVMLREDDGLFIDNMTTEDLQRDLGRDVAVFSATPSGLYEVLRQKLGR
jgi:putative radical SAM enzyme (TIGR03279 family)